MVIENNQEEIQAKSEDISLAEMISYMNGIDENGEARTWGAIQINKIETHGKIAVIAEHELYKAVFEIHIRDNFVQLNIDFPKDARASLVLIKRVLIEYDKLCATAEDIQDGVYYMHMSLLPLEFLGQTAFVLRNVVLWINGEHPFDADIQRMVLLFEKNNCAFVSTDEIDMVSVRAEIERDIRLQYELEEREYMEQEAALLEQAKKQEEQERNKYLMELSGMESMDKKKDENSIGPRIRFSDTDNIVE